MTKCWPDEADSADETDRSSALQISASPDNVGYSRSGRRSDEE
jgi:hypothetical protein